MKTVLLVGVLAAIAGQAAALSCLRPDVARSYMQAAEAEDLYVVLYGGFVYEAPPSSETGDINAPEEVEFSALFVGSSLSAQGFRPIEPFDMTIRLTCAGPWCGNMPENGGIMMGFAEATPDGYLLTVGPCGGNLFTNVSRAQFDTVEACGRGETCQEAPMQ